MSGTKLAVLLTAAGMAAALLSACGTDDAAGPARGTDDSAGPASGETGLCPEAKSGDEFEDKPQSDIDSVEIDLRDPEVEVTSSGTQGLWSPEVSNDSGQDLTDAALEVSTDQPGECLPGLTVSNHPDECSASEEEEPGCTAREKAGEDCDYTEASGKEGTGRGARATCVKDVVSGDNAFTLDLGMPDYEGSEDWEAVDNYPDVEVHAQLTVADEIVAAASSPVTITI